MTNIRLIKRRDIAEERESAPPAPAPAEKLSFGQLTQTALEWKSHYEGRRLSAREQFAALFAQPQPE